MNAIVNAHLVSRLSKFMVEPTFRGRSPAASITAPDPELPRLALLTEDERLATFEQSRRTFAGRRAEYIKP